MMTSTPDTGLQPETEPGIASAEGGLVFLDGPDGLAKTLTPDAAAKTGRSLIDAAEVAEAQDPAEVEASDDGLPGTGA